MDSHFLLTHVELALPADCKKIIVAVSGGIDSVVLLHVLCKLRARHNLELLVVHLDHQIRAESSSDAQFVSSLSERWQIPCRVAAENIPAAAKAAGQSLEMAGRHARRQLFMSLAEEHDCDLVALAHHQDDQIETFMLRLVRGSGPSGLAAMRQQQDLWWRPLLGCSRAQIEGYADQFDLQWVEDSSNVDLVYLRNRMRHQVLPLLRELNPAFNERTAALVTQLQSDDDYWSRQVACYFDRLVVDTRDGLRLSRERLLALHPALRMRIVREALRRVRGGLAGIEGSHLAAVDRLLTSGPSQGQLDLPGCWVARRYEILWLRGLAPAPLPDYNEILPVPGRLTLPEGVFLDVSLQLAPQAESATVVEFDAEILSQPICVRSWRPGDRFQPLGMAGHKKIKSYLGDAKVEMEDRQRLLVLVSGGEILWLVGHRRSALAGVTSDCQKILRLELSS